MNNSTPILGVALLFAGLLLWLQGGQAALFIQLNALTATLPDWLWANLTLLADTLWAVAALLIAASYRPRLLGQALLVLLVGGLIVHLGKAGFDAARPAKVLAEDAFHIIGPTLKHHSFPSGHAFTAMAAAGLLAMTFTRFAAIILVVGLAAAVSRVAVGAHWPLDVLVGGGLGLLTAWGCIVWSNNRAWVHSNGWRFSAMCLLTLATLALAFHDDRYPDTQLLTVVTSLLALVIAGQRLWWPLWRLIRQTDQN
ncbi:hypothetical protein CHH28_15740 [Bacterioplanes sanyensis]|uniref:undecaprenyl-diphosphate phosphatase n=1 Tax=Bacterioplanes sanyensis TaxID=1249553 RepID=A0A222FND5_9GAMM|nr:phosphatase PAP2 family protein [Bacterioplanes sanyensis]ASP40034.1 hypothetical protein CHH28_15740 [Bacterioplanes sanyensis]